MNKWNELSMSERAAFINVAVKHGLTNMSDIHNLYNEYSDGGYLNNLTTKPFSYTPIPEVRYADGGKKQSYRDWRRKISKYKGIDIKHDDTYDYKGFYNDDPNYAYQMLEQNKDAHFTDKFKTPTHPTFSDESIYSNGKQIGGHWNQLPSGQWEFQHSDYTFEHSDETNQYLRENDKGSFATYRGGIVLDGASHGMSENVKKVFAPIYRGEFEEAFAKARNKGREFFRWNGNLYNTRLKYEENEKHNGITQNNNPQNVKYNIFDDELSYESRDAHRKSLEEWAAKNPTIYGINTSEFIDFLSQISGIESSYNHNAGKGMKYSGWYGLQGGRELSKDQQHKAAFKHLASIFKENMVKQDVQRGIELGYSPAQILAKYWNQGNRVTDFIYNGKDFEDGAGTAISKYGWNITSNVDIDKYLSDSITDDFVVIKNAKTLSDAIKRARVNGMNYSNRENHILNLNRVNDATALDASKLHVGDTIWLVDKNKQNNGGNLYKFGKWLSKKDTQNNRIQALAQMSKFMPTTEMTLSDAIKFNHDTPHNAFMQNIDGTFYYPEELQPAVIYGDSNMNDEQLKNYKEGRQFGQYVANQRDANGVPLVLGAVSIPLSFMGGATAFKYLPQIAGASKFITPGYWLSKAGAPILGVVADVGTGVYGTISGGIGTVKNIKDGEYGKAALNAGLTGLGIASDIATIRMMTPQVRAIHAFNNIAPFGYNNPVERGKRMLSGILEDTPVDLNNPTWNEAVQNSAISKGLLQYNKNLQNATEIARAGRMAAFKKYLGLPDNSNIYLPNGDGTYRYNLDKIIDMSNGTWAPVFGTDFKTVPDWDYVTTAGGNLTRLNHGRTGVQTFGANSDVLEQGYQHISDIWDLNPFQGKDFIRGGIESGLNSIGINNGNLIKRMWNNKLLTKLDNKINNFEVGPILGGKPFEMVTDIPYTITAKDRMNYLYGQVNINPSGTVHLKKKIEPFVAKNGFDSVYSPDNPFVFDFAPQSFNQLNFGDITKKITK